LLHVLLFLQAARDLSDTGEEGEGMEGSPGSPSIEEKELKAASQPSNTHGNTSGSNESDASKRCGRWLLLFGIMVVLVLGGLQELPSSAWLLPAAPSGHLQTACLLHTCVWCCCITKDFALSSQCVRACVVCIYNGLLQVAGLQASLVSAYHAGMLLLTLLCCPVYVSCRRQGTAQGEGSNPTNGNSSGNGYSVKDSNTGTNTGTNGHTNGNGHGYSCGELLLWPQHM
jgi:hypothetical protein